MRRMALGSAIIYSAIVCAFGQIGETKSQITTRYGEAYPTEKLLTEEYDKLTDDQCAFSHSGLQILVGFKNAKAVLLLYQKLDHSPMSKEEVFAILRKAIAKPDWVLTSEDSRSPRWRSGDSSVVAYYYSE